MFVPPHMFCKILISRLIFFFLTGFRILMTHFVLLTTLMPSNTYFANNVEKARSFEFNGISKARLWARSRSYRSTTRRRMEFTGTYLTVFTTTNLSDYFILFLITPIYSESFVVPIVSWSVDINIRVNSAER